MRKFVVWICCIILLLLFGFLGMMCCEMIPRNDLEIENRVKIISDHLKITDIEKLSLQHNDILVFRIAEYDRQSIDQIIGVIEAHVRKAGIKNISFIILDAGDSIEAINEDKMNKFGWKKIRK